ncbi:MAG: hypothetical protein M3Q07_07380, partial [Pseudobdellovibrionaceae bacterium]|nr:hypothetical protein [Pseudobdellovibrionaceae bacterium]
MPCEQLKKKLESEKGTHSNSLWESAQNRTDGRIQVIISPTEHCQSFNSRMKTQRIFFIRLQDHGMIDVAFWSSLRMITPLPYKVAILDDDPFHRQILEQLCA